MRVLGPMDKASNYEAGDIGFETRRRLSNALLRYSFYYLTDQVIKHRSFVLTVCNISNIAQQRYNTRYRTDAPMLSSLF